MLCIINEFSDSGDLLESLLPELRESNLPSGRKDFSARYTSLTLEQKSCIAEFLRYLSICHKKDFPNEIYGNITPNRILSEFWSEYLEE